MADGASFISKDARAQLGQITLVLQGGGALGAYQGGVYQALCERGLEPDWIIGTSIGAINGGLIAGNPPGKRVEALRDFWRRVEQTAPPTPSLPLGWVLAGNPFASADTVSAVLSGIPGFFEPNIASLVGGPQARLGPGNASYYSTAPLKKTLTGLIDLKQLNSQAPRLMVGAANVHLGTMKYFDSRHMWLGLEHVLASGALPPSFPAVMADGAYFWDGGILSNTPIEAVFSDLNRKSGVVFSVEVWHRKGPDPDSIFEVLKREKDIQYSSRLETQIEQQKEMHRLRHIIMELAAHFPEEKLQDANVQDCMSYGCATEMHVILLQAPALDDETYLKDIDFSAQGIRTRWQAGYDHTIAAVDREPWRTPTDPLEGVKIHRYPPEPSEVSAGLQSPAAR
jgi:NTE family protein